MKLSHWVTAAATMLAANLLVASEAVVVDRSMSEQEVLDAQQGWCDALLAIGQRYSSEGHAAAKALAGQVIDAAYGYQMGVVLFKPTLTVNPQTFRTTRAGALSYFVGGDASFPKDDGFALKGWKSCDIDNAAIFIAGDSATTLGKVQFTDGDGNKTSVDKTWVFVKDDLGSLRIVGHHSSLEHQGE
ncbi:MAG: hypothetical protein HRT77_17300 [Halioglobus sp.]|nr:hypothetical protein [Halioglobus sp.]